MNAHMKAQPTAKEITFGVTVIIVLAIGIIFLFANKKDQPSIYGVYRIYSNDPAVQLFIAGQNTYLKLNEDRTIVYNTTINGVPKFHFEGTFIQHNNELAITWKDGKLPGKLKIETQQNNQIIKIGSTLYKKEKAGS